MRLKAVPRLIVSAAKKWSRDNAARLGAALAYYTIFAIPPLFVIVLYIASLFLSGKTVQTELFAQIGDIVGEKAASTIQSTLTLAGSSQKGIIATTLAVVGLTATATGLFLELQGALNTIWGVRAKSGQGVWGLVKNRLLGFSLVMGSGLLLMLSVAASTVIAAASHYLNRVAPGLGVIWNLGNELVSILVITVLFALIFKLLPDVRISWRDVWIGAFATALLFTAGKLGLGLYLGKNSTVSAYGTAGSVVLVLLWVYYSSQILFFGAELTQVYANQFGAEFAPKAHAEWILPGAAASGSPAGSSGQAVRPPARRESLKKVRAQIAVVDELIRRKRIRTT